jgi:hypothetical protein
MSGRSGASVSLISIETDRGSRHAALRVHSLQFRFWSVK